jgi:outer membrane lipoprotein-sorting protein
MTGADVRLWYDPKTLKLLKRTVDFGKKDSQGTIRESYEEFTLNADIPEEKFKLPAEK